MFFFVSLKKFYFCYSSLGSLDLQGTTAVTFRFDRTVEDITSSPVRLPANISISDTLDFEINFDELRVHMAVLIPIIKDALTSIQMGQLTRHGVACFASTLLVPSVLSGFGLSSSGFIAQLSGFTDAVGTSFGEAINGILPLYGSIMLGSIASLIVETSTVTLSRQECPVVPQGKTTGDDNIISLATMLQNLDLPLNLSNQEIQSLDAIVPDNNELKELLFINQLSNTTVEFDLLDVNGWSQTVTMRLVDLNFMGISPISINMATVQAAQDDPSDILLSVQGGSLENPLGVRCSSPSYLGRTLQNKHTKPGRCSRWTASCI